MASLYARMFGLAVAEEEKANAAEIAIAAEVPEFRVKGGANHEFDESLTEEQRKKMQEDAVSMDEIGSLVQGIVGMMAEGAELELKPDEFEKDDDSNFHIAYITAASNLRARCYSIPEVDFFRTKIIAGKIIPAIATTTSLVSALVVIELLKVVQGVAVDKYKNAFLNLALPVIQLSEPSGPEQKAFGDKGIKFSEWDRWEVRLGPAVTLEQFLTHCHETYGGEVQGIFHLGKTVYMASMPTHASRKKKKMHELPGIKVKPGQVEYIDIVVAFNDANGEAVDKNPPVRLFFTQ